MTTINNHDLYRKHDQLIQLKKETYERIYNRCKNMIKMASDMGELICFFEIPEFIFGSSYPMINVKYCSNYIRNKLHQANKNIRTEFIEPNIIFIDWRREQDLYDQYAKKSRGSHHSERSYDSCRSGRSDRSDRSDRYNRSDYRSDRYYD